MEKLAGVEGVEPPTNGSARSACREQALRVHHSTWLSYTPIFHCVTGEPIR